jgi:hypothetical protein
MTFVEIKEIEHLVIKISIYVDKCKIRKVNNGNRSK